jgi:hypothetical protein
VLQYLTHDMPQALEYIHKITALLCNCAEHNKITYKTKLIFSISGIPLELPPLREVNHEINLVDPTKRIRYWLPKCQEHFHEDLSVKIKIYTTAEWWELAVVHQAVPMLCVPKKNGTLRTVFDLREQNENMVKDVTPFLDQDIIRNDIVCATYWTKLGMSEAYEQIRVDPAHVSNTAFATILGTFRGQVMQVGDCNVPSMFQCLMMVIFCDCHIFGLYWGAQKTPKHSLRQTTQEAPFF